MGRIRIAVVPAPGSPMITINDIPAEVRGADVIGIVLFGSVARGDDTRSSDIDLLLVTKSRRDKKKIGRLACSVYPISALEKMMAVGSLFARHVFLEGIILSDPTGAVAEAIRRYVPAVSYAGYLEDLAVALDRASASIGRANPKSVFRVLLYIIRTCVYIVAERRKIDTFSIMELSRELEDQRLQSIHAQKYKPLAPTTSELHAVATVAKEYLWEARRCEAQNEVVEEEAGLARNFYEEQSRAGTSDLGTLFGTSPREWVDQQLQGKAY